MLEGHRSLVLVAALAGTAAGTTGIVALAVRVPATASAADCAPVTGVAKPSPFGSWTPDTPPAPVECDITKALVTITTYASEDRLLAQSAGYIYSTNGIVVTTYKAIRGASSISIETSTGDELRVIAVMGYRADRDVAALAVSESNLPALSTDTASGVGIGDGVFVIDTSGKAVRATVTSLRVTDGVDTLKMDGPIALRGTPVLNERRKVIGLSTGAGIAVPIRFIPELLAAGDPASRIGGFPAASLAGP